MSLSSIDHNNEVGVSKHIPVTHLNSPTIAETKDGKIFSVIKLEGVPFQTERNETINQFNRLWQRLITSLNENVCLYVTVYRKSVDHNLSGQFDNLVLQKINDDYMKQFKSRTMFLNDIYITVLYRGINAGKLGKGVSIINRLSDSFIKKSRSARRHQQIIELNKIIDRISSALSSFKPALLGIKDTKTSELLKFLSIFVNASDELPLPLAGNAASVAKSISNNLQMHQKYPQGNLAQYLPLKRLYFGENIQFQGNTQSDNKFSGILSIKSYPEESASVALNSLMQLDCEWISTHSYAIEANDVLLKKARLQRNKLSNVNDAGVTQINELSFLEEQIQIGHVNAGYHHHTLMVLADTQEKLDYQINQAARCYLDVGIPIVRETLGQEAAFWAQFPGNLIYIARSALITSQNFADFCPLHNYKTGYRDGNHLGSAVTLLETTSKTPFFFNFHKQGERNELTPGHTTIIGSNGAGKTVLMTFLDAQLSRYHGRSIFFDRNRGTEIFVRATGGVYSILSPDHPEETCFNPLLLEDTGANRAFCKAWLAQLCKRTDESSLKASIMEHISACIDYAFDKLRPNHRQLSHATLVLPIDFERWPELNRWVRKNNNLGEYAYIFDNATDSLKEQDKLGFDMTHFLDNEPAEIRTAVLMYLFHWIKQALDGRLMAIWLDEAWQYFVDPYWENELKKTLPTFRKLNAFLVMATQSASSVAESSLRNMVLDNSATQIFFPNPDGREEYYQQGFSLTESEFAFIKENEAKCRQFLVKKGHDSAICSLDLIHMPKMIKILSATRGSIQSLDSLRNKLGDEPERWLSEFLRDR